MDKIAVLIPAYNEEQTIKKVICDFSTALPDATIYVYSNNSTDATEHIAKESGAEVKTEHKQGKGNVIRRMFREIDAECYIMVDADDTYPAEASAQMADLILNEGVDMVIGDRLTSTYFTENKRPFHNVGNRLVRKAIQTMFQTDIKDIMTGYRALSYEFVKTFPVLSQGFEIETEMTIHAIDKNMRIQSIPIMYRNRPEGSYSKLNTYIDGVKVLGTIVSLYEVYRPLRFFGGLGLLLAVLSIGFFYPVLKEYLKTGLVPNFPTLIVCGFTMMAAIQSFFTGLTLQTILKKNKQDFEMDLQRIARERRNG